MFLFHVKNFPARCARFSLYHVVIIIKTELDLWAGFFFFFLIIIREAFSGEIPFQGRETPYKGGGVIRHLDHV
jgi:hypothetical protein